MIKREEGCIVLIFKKIVKGVACVYKVNLTTKKVIHISQEEIETPLNWNEEKIRVKEILEEAVIEMDERIFNNKNVMYTARVQKEEKELEKAEKHLEKNKEILIYIKSYKV